MLAIKAMGLHGARQGACRWLLSAFVTALPRPIVTDHLPSCLVTCDTSRQCVPELSLVHCDSLRRCLLNALPVPGAGLS